MWTPVSKPFRNLVARIGFEAFFAACKEADLRFDRSKPLATAGALTWVMHLQWLASMEQWKPCATHWRVVVPSCRGSHRTAEKGWFPADACKNECTSESNAL